MEMIEMKQRIMYVILAILAVLMSIYATADELISNRNNDITQSKEMDTIDTYLADKVGFDKSTEKYWVDCEDSDCKLYYYSNYHHGGSRGGIEINSFQNVNMTDNDIDAMAKREIESFKNTSYKVVLSRNAEPKAKNRIVEGKVLSNEK